VNIGAVLLALEGQDQGRALTAEGLGVTGLLTVANRPLLQRATDLLATAGIRDVVVASTQSVAAAVRRAVGEAQVPHQRIRHVELPAGAGALAGVLAARSLLDDGPVVLHGDDSLVLGGMAEAVDHFTHEGLDALQIAVSSPARAQAHALNENGAIALRQRPRPVGVQILGERALGVLEALEGERGALATLDDLPDAVREAGGRVSLEDHARAWRFSGEVDSFLEINRMVLERLAADASPQDGELRPSVRVEGPVLIDPTAEVRNAKLRGPVLVGPGAVVRDSYVGPYTCIAAGACLEGAEIEYSVVLRDARINHVGVRIEDSVIGAGAQVQRTFTMPTALRMHVGPGASVSLS
jgi:glucose-1-phosphate thymidylyltransferase